MDSRPQVVFEGPAKQKRDYTPFFNDGVQQGVSQVESGAYYSYVSISSCGATPPSGTRWGLESIFLKKIGATTSPN